ncbi:MAG: aspartyl/asparaginyl beta-hydroxylase domain-containing protein [Pseudomonadota bacterium]
MNEFDMNEKTALLRQWCHKNNVAETSLKNIFDMLTLGRRADKADTDPMQFPACYVRDEDAKAWHDPNQYSWVKILEANFQDIKKEALSIFQSELMDVHPENDDLAGYGTWNTFFFYKNGEEISKNLQRCPLTAKVLDQINGVNIAGRTYFSAMTPGIHIKPHCGPHNFKLRTHLGIVTPKEAVIRVGDETRPWQEGKCIVFDDSFEHEVWNKSSEIRIVLIVDVWNPILTQDEIMALKYIMPEFYKHAE